MILFTHVYPSLVLISKYIPPLSAPHPPVSSPLFFSFHFYLSRFILSSTLLAHPFICLSPFAAFIPYLFCLSLPCHTFIPPLLSFLSHLIPLCTHPFIRFPICHFGYFTDCLSETVLTKQCAKCHFLKTESNSFLGQIALSSYWHDGTWSLISAAHPVHDTSVVVHSSPTHAGKTSLVKAVLQSAISPGQSSSLRLVPVSSPPF